jgi:hypothetical protein
MDYLPKVQMDFIPSDNESDVEENVNKETGEENPNFIYSDEEDLEKEDNVEKVVPKAKSKREDMNVNEIFTIPNNDGVIINDPTVKLTKKGKPRKQRPPMTEAHKEKLKIAREKAMASRIAKAKERKENLELEKQEKELLKQQKVKRVKQLKEEVDSEANGTLPTHMKELEKQERVGVTVFSKKDLEQAQLQAIINYEKIRKSRKAEKEERKKMEAEEEAIKAQLRRAVAPPQKEYNPFNGCY